MKVWQRRLGIIWVVALIIWLPIEDTQVWLSLVLALAACIWLGMRLLTTRAKFRIWQANAYGAVLGAGVPLIAISLMAFKSGLHGHGFPDFTARQVWSMWSAVPYGLALGGLLGFASRLFFVHGGKTN